MNFKPTLIEQFVAKRRLDVIAEKAILHDFAQEIVLSGRPAVERFLNDLFHAAFPTAELTLHTGLRQNNILVLEFTLIGRQTGPFWGLPTTGRFVRTHMTLIGRLEQHQLQRLALYYDAGSLLRQLNLAL